MAKLLDLLSKDHSINPTTGRDKSLSSVEDFLSVGSWVSNLYLGGGLPVGRIIQIYGPPGAGKSALCMHAAADCQAKGGLVIWFATETAWDRDKAENMGVDIDQVLLFHPEYVEKCFELILMFSKEIKDLSDIKPLEFYDNEILAKQAYVQDQQAKSRPNKNAIKIVNAEIELLKLQRVINNFKCSMQLSGDIDAPVLLVWDSLSASPSYTQLNYANQAGGQYAGGMMERPRVIGDWLKLVSIPVAKAKICLVITSHISGGPGMGGQYQEKYETSGGNASKHTYSMRIDISAAKGDGDGQNTNFRVKKNRFNKPLLRWVAYQNFRTGFDPIIDTYNAMIHQGILVSGRGYEYDKDYPDLHRWGKGSPLGEFKNHLLANPDYHKELNARLRTNILNSIGQFDWHAEVAKELGREPTPEELGEYT